MNRHETIARLVELETAIEEYPYWGGWLTAADEKRNELRASLGLCRRHRCENDRRYTSGYCGIHDAVLEAGGARIAG